MKLIKKLIIIITLSTTSMFAEVVFKFHYTDAPGTGLNSPENTWARETIEKAGKIVGDSLLHEATINIEVKEDNNEVGHAAFFGCGFMKDIFDNNNNSTKMYGPISINLTGNRIEKGTGSGSRTSLLHEIIHEITHGLGIGIGTCTLEGTFSNTVSPYIECGSYDTGLFKGFYASNVLFDCTCNRPKTCVHLIGSRKAPSIMSAISPNSNYQNRWDKSTASVLADLGYCLKTEFFTTQECLFTKREFPQEPINMFFKDETEFQESFKVVILDKATPILAHSVKKRSEGQYTVSDEHKIYPLSNNDLELSVYWQGVEKKIILSSERKIGPEKTYALGATGINIVVSNLWSGFTISFKAKKAIKTEEPLFQKLGSADDNTDSIFNQMKANLLRHVYAYRQIIRVDHDVAFSLVVKDDEHLYFQENVTNSKLNKKYSLKPNAHLIGTATPQSKILLKLNDATTVAEFTLSSDAQQSQIVQIQNGKEYKVDFQVIDKYQESNIPEYFLLVDITPIS